jgi:hypothetical protein
LLLSRPRAVAACSELARWPSATTLGRRTLNTAASPASASNCKASGGPVLASAAPSSRASAMGTLPHAPSIPPLSCRSLALSRFHDRHRLTGDSTGDFADASRPPDGRPLGSTDTQAPPPGSHQEKAMFTHPEITSQLASEHQRQMLAAASQRQLRRQHDRQAPKAANIAATIIRRLATVIAKPSL